MRQSEISSRLRGAFVLTQSLVRTCRQDRRQAAVFDEGEGTSSSDTARKKNRELGRLVVNFHASSGPARAHCCLTDEQVQNAPERTVKKSVNTRHLWIP